MSPAVVGEAAPRAGSGLAGLAAATTEASATAVPAIVAAANPAYEEAADKATILVSASVVVTSLLVPVVTLAYQRRLERRGVTDGQDARNAQTDDGTGTGGGTGTGPERGPDAGAGEGAEPGADGGTGADKGTGARAEARGSTEDAAAESRCSS